MTGTEDRDRTGDAAAYNYRHFGVGTAAMETLERRVSAGDSAPDATVYSLDGDPVDISALWTDRPLVVEFGSFTCPVFTGKIRSIDELAARHDDVTFVVVYVREAHPGRKIPPHGSFAEKVTNARRVAEEDGVRRPVLVDDVEGTMHRRYDTLPNSVYVIGTDGVVAHRADWADPETLEAVLDRLRAAEDRGAAVTPTDRELNFARPTPDQFRELARVFRRPGADSALDFVQTVPRLAAIRLRRRLNAR